MGKDLISIIITTYKRPHFIKRALENCENQTYQNIELIVVDDNGLDTQAQVETQIAINEFLGKKKIKYLPLACNMGACHARNYGVKHCLGEFISFFDDDDEWTNSKLELQYDALSKSDMQTGMVLAGQKMKNEKTGYIYSETQYSNFHKDAFNLLLNSNLSFATPNPLIRKKTFLTIGGFCEGLLSSQDLEFGIRMSQSFKIIAIPEICLTSKVHVGDRISTNHEGKIQGFKYILSQYYADISENGRIYYWQRILMHSFFGLLRTNAKESAVKLKELGAFTLKYRCFYIGIFLTPVRFLLKVYLKFNNSLY